jgi:hypothetical protein
MEAGKLRREDATMHWLVAVLAATSGITMSFAICAFVWAWYVGTIVLVLSNEETQGEAIVHEGVTLLSPSSRG